MHACSKMHGLALAFRVGLRDLCHTFAVAAWRPGFLLPPEPSLHSLLGHSVAAQQPLSVGLIGSALLTLDLSHDYSFSLSLPRNDPHTRISRADLSSEHHACLSEHLLNIYTACLKGFSNATCSEPNLFLPAMFHPNLVLL